MSDRATIFGSEAEAYDRLRPRYPNEVIDLVVAARPDLVVDAGCGTGIAARQVADRGARVLGIEPDPQMATVARSRGIQTVVSSFEQWRPVPCDVVYSAQAWHWIDPHTGARVAAEAIRPGGRWLAFWNVEADETVDAVRLQVLESVAPQLVEDRPRTHLGDESFWSAIHEGLLATGGFEGIEMSSVDWVDSISGTRLVDRLDTHSAHRLLDGEQREFVRSALREAFGDGQLDVRYTTEVMTAHRR